MHAQNKADYSQRLTAAQICCDAGLCAHSIFRAVAPIISNLALLYATMCP